MNKILAPKIPAKTLQNKKKVVADNYLHWSYHVTLFLKSSVSLQIFFFPLTNLFDFFLHLFFFFLREHPLLFHRTRYFLKRKEKKIPDCRLSQIARRLISTKCRYGYILHLGEIQFLVIKLDKYCTKKLGSYSPTNTRAINNRKLLWCLIILRFFLKSKVYNNMAPGHQNGMVNFLVCRFGDDSSIHRLCLAFDLMILYSKI